MKSRKRKATAGRNHSEEDAARRYVDAFRKSRVPLDFRIRHMGKFLQRQDVTRLISLYEVFKKILHVSGSIVECGVRYGDSLMTWANLSAILEPANLTRWIYGFDTFTGFPRAHKNDHGIDGLPQKGAFPGEFAELKKIIHAFDKNRFLGHIPKIRLIKGNAIRTIPSFLKKNTHLVVSLLFLDFDLYEPTKIALESFLPRMPKGAVVVFDELNNPLWPGETLALLKTVGIRKLKIRRIPWDPYLGYMVV